MQTSTALLASSQRADKQVTRSVSEPQVIPNEVREKVELLLQVLCEFYGTRREYFINEDRSNFRCDRKLIAMYLARHELKLTYRMLGLVFKRSKSTVTTNIERAEKKIAQSPAIAEEVKLLTLKYRKP